MGFSRRFAKVFLLIVALGCVVMISSANATTNLTETSPGVYTASVPVNGTGDDCPPGSRKVVQIMYDSNTQTVGFQHGGVPANQTVTGTVQVSSGSGASATATVPAGSTGVATHAAGASGVALPMVLAKGLTGGSLNASATATVTYSWTEGDCTYTVTLTVSFDQFGNVQSVTSNP
jgi:hypothetical protein